MANETDPRHMAIIDKYSRRKEQAELEAKAMVKGFKKFVTEALENPINKKNLAREALAARRGGKRLSYKEGFNSFLEDDPDLDADGNVIITDSPWQR